MGTRRSGAGGNLAGFSAGARTPPQTSFSNPFFTKMDVPGSLSATGMAGIPPTLTLGRDALSR